MIRKVAGLTGTLLLLAGLLGSPVAQAFNFGNMMNPSRWFGGNRDYHDDYYDGPRGPGYGPGHYGAPYGGYSGYGGYGAPAYAPPAYVQPAPVYQAPAAATTDNSGEIRRLKQRIEELENDLSSTKARQQTYNNPAPEYRPPAPPVANNPPAYAPANTATGTGQPGHQQPAPVREWMPSGYYHPAMQQ